MARPIVTCRLAGSPLSAQSDEFAGLLRRLLVSLNHVLLVAHNFGDLADLPPEHVPAGMTLHEASRDLDRLYDEIDAWYVGHDHFPKNPGTRSGLPLAAATSEAIAAAAESAAIPALPPIGASDKTADRIHAFLMSVRPLQGSDGDDKYQRGRVLIERMALSAKGEDDPAIVLSPAHCADVLNFLSRVEPFEPQTWWKDPVDAPSHVVGFEFVLRTLEGNLRRESEMVHEAKS